MRFLRRAVLRLAAGVALAVGGYLAAALGLGFLPVNSGFRPTPGGTEIFVCSNGVHTDFVLPVKTAEIDWSAWFPDADFAAPDAAPSRLGYAAIGWGNLYFYLQTPTWAEVRPGVALRSLLPLDPSVLHVTYRHRPESGENCRRLAIAPEQYRALARYIEDGLLQDPGQVRVGGGGHSAAGALKPWLLAGRGYGWNDAFYRAKGRYSVIDSCNVWVGRGLAASGLPTGRWTPFDFLVLRHLDAP